MKMKWCLPAEFDSNCVSVAFAGRKSWIRAIRSCAIHSGSPREHSS
jgi:hypothetical protein